MLEAVGVRKTYRRGGGLFGGGATIQAVADADFVLRKGETLGLVGESGSGKSTLARCVVRLVHPEDGAIRFHDTDLARLNRRAWKPMRKRIQMVFQDPFASLNPRRRVGEIIAEGPIAHGTPRPQALARAADLLKLVQLDPSAADRFPHEFSGGQRQRIGIARALALNPSLIVADEPVSALDVSVQAQIVNLMLELQDRLGLAYLFVAHDLSVVKHVSHRVAVMYVGRIVEIAPTAALFETPKHPYTEALLSAVPVPDPRRRAQRIVLEGDVADPSDPPSGCHFHPRCPYAQDRCRVETPALTELVPGHAVRCLRAAELALQGVAPPVAAGPSHVAQGG
ncbi:MAG: ABC transporter ATP-binding protein [Rhodospirillales bacterium]|nr:ABC transporter ATP-binding protein [Rhodospirillales bacterium]